MPLGSFPPIIYLYGKNAENSVDHTEQAQYTR